MFDEVFGLVAGEVFEGAGEDEGFALEGLGAFEAFDCDDHSPIAEAFEVLSVFGGVEPTANAVGDFRAHAVEVF